MVTRSDMNLDFSAALETVRQMSVGFIAILPKLAVALIVLFIFYLVAQLAGRVVLRATVRRSTGLSIILQRLIKTVLIVFGLLVALSVVAPQFGATELVGLLGIGGVAIGFAFRDIFQNFLAGILILLTRPFDVGDQIQVKDFEGTVENIETRATTMRTYDGRRVVIPNSDLFTEAVVVNTAFDMRRSEYDIGIGYEDDIETARGHILDVLAETEGVMASPEPEVLVVELDESSVNLRARWWTSTEQINVMRIRDRVITGVKYRLDNNGINIPFPIRTVMFNDDTGYFDRNGGPAEAA
jgi:small conductance mechanosensitive channel